MPRKKGSTGQKNHKWIPNLCDLCGESFRASRPDARFCSPKCRQADYRIRCAAAVLAQEHASAEEAARLSRLAALAEVEQEQIDNSNDRRVEYGHRPSQATRKRVRK